MSLCIFLAEQRFRRGPRIDKYQQLLSKNQNDMGYILKLETVVGMSDPTISHAPNNNISSEAVFNS